ncbi:MAG: hypothetical protein ABJA70_09325 [Chryseolinea sp.]
MEKVKIKQNINTWGWTVTTFPNGISDSFDKLLAMVPDGIERTFYGISYMEGGKIVYNATIEERYAGEAETYNCKRYTIDKGDYVAATVKDWRHQLHTIKDVFTEMVRQAPDLNQPAIEWYKNNDEMVCMVRVTNDENAAKR